MRQTDDVSGHVFLKKYSRMLHKFPRYVYEKYLELGRGVLIMDETKGGEKPVYYYSTVSKTDEYEVSLDDYDPDSQIYFVWKRPDYPDECFVYEDPRSENRPWHRHRYTKGI